LFPILLSGISDFYQLFEAIANTSQTVDLLPHERYDKIMKLVEQFQLMMTTCNDHSCCPNDEECHWPLYHHDLAKMKSDGTYQNVNLLQDYPKRIRQTRLAANDQTVRTAMDVYTDVQLRLGHWQRDSMKISK